MTNQEAIEILEHLKGVNPQSLHKPNEQIEAYDIAINALKSKARRNNCTEVPQAHKFKAGDWIVSIDDEGDVSTEMVVSFTRNKVLLVDTDGCRTEYPKTELNGFHLWSMADAKDGDVLVCYSEVKGTTIEQAGIFKQYVGRYGGCSNTFLAHTGIDWDGDIIINGYMGSTNILPATKEQRELLFQKIKESGYEWYADKKELLSAVPKFKVGDWIVRGKGFVYEPSLITEIRDYYICELLNGERVTYTLNDVHKNFHLWAIADAKDGDVLATDNGWACIFQAFDGWTFSSYCFMDSQNWFCDFGSEVHTPDSKINGHIHPATKEQRDLLFAKMREAGYHWDTEKKELKKIPKHYDISNFKPFDKVLIRVGNMSKWTCNFFSYYHEGFHCIGTDDWNQCIPFEGNEHLLGTTEPCDERYINW